MKKFLLIALIIFLTACTSSGKKPVDKLYFRFPEAQTVQIDKKIKVKRPTALGILGNRPMVVQNNDGALLQMQHHFWLDSPKVLLHNYMQDSFGKFNNTEFTLSSTILKFEKHQNMAVVSISFELKDVNNKLLFNKTYSLTDSYNGNDISGFASSARKLVEQIVSQLIKDIQ